jgi:predicted DNA-binding transcriptional regulator YafY
VSLGRTPGKGGRTDLPRADRLFALVQLLSTPVGQSLGALAETLETSPRSLYRDLADLEARGIAIERAEGRYRLMDGASVRNAPLTARERVLLSLALENPGIESQPAYRDLLRTLRRKLARPGRTTSPLALSGPDRSGLVTAGIPETIEQAIEAAHSISMLYTSLSSGRRTWRGVDPWVVLHRSEAWYLIGRCHLHDAPRTFRLDRVTAVLPIGSPFERPVGFDVEKWFEASWGVEAAGWGDDAAGELHEVHIVFDSRVAPLIEHGRHHKNETKQRRPDGRLDYRVTIGPLEELARWITGFAGAAIAMTPPELVQRVRAIAGGAADAHAQAGAAKVAARTIVTNSRPNRQPVKTPDRSAKPKAVPSSDGGVEHDLL